MSPNAQLLTWSLSVLSSCASLGLPLVSSDVCPPPLSQSSRSLLPCPSQQPQPQGPPQAALLPTPQQHPMGNHMIAQVRTSIWILSDIKMKVKKAIMNS